MPYGSKTKTQDRKIERCVKRLMADSGFKPRKGETKKVAAIKVCKSTILKK